MLFCTSQNDYLASNQLKIFFKSSLSTDVTMHFAIKSSLWKGKDRVYSVLLQHLAHAMCFWFKNQTPTCHYGTNQSQQKKHIKGKILLCSLSKGLRAVQSLTVNKVPSVSRHPSRVSNSFTFPISIRPLWHVCYYFNHFSLIRQSNLQQIQRSWKYKICFSRTICLANSH